MTWLKAIRDPRRDPAACTFPIEYVLMMALIMLCGQLGSRRALARQLGLGRIGSNLWRLVGKAYGDLGCHPDTMNRAMEVLDPAELEKLMVAVVYQLRKTRALDTFRFDGKLIVAVDGTKMFTFKKVHCEHCTHQTKDGKTTYFHCVLAAKIVTPIGLIIPLAFEFIENPPAPYDKQDCELKAWRRLYDKIRRLFPRLPINVVGDGLYAEEQTFATADQAGWNFVITLTDDKLPSVTAQLPPKSASWSGHRTERVHLPDGGKTHRWIDRTVRWKTPVHYHGQIYHVIELEETDEKGNRLYYNRWITNVKPTFHNAFELAQTGRLRWKIENEGTNTQKNGGYEMGHAYGRKGNAWKNYYYMLQLAQMLNDLVRLGDYIKKATADPTASFTAVFAAMETFAMMLIAHLRETEPDFDLLPGSGRFQIRLGFP